MTIVHESSAVANTSGAPSSLACNKPTGVADGDVLVGKIVLGGGSGQTITPPTGWTLIARINYTTNHANAAYYKVITDYTSEPATYTWSWTTGDTASVGISRYSGVDTGTPLDCAATTNTAISTTPIGLSITTATANAMVVWDSGHGANSDPITQPASFVEEWEISTARQNEHADLIFASAGATGNQTGSIGNTRIWSVVMWALRPITTGGGDSLASLQRSIRQRRNTLITR